MNNPSPKQYFPWILLTETVGFLSGWITRTGTAAFQASAIQPPFSPPGWVFPIVWPVLYALMGIGAARIYAMPASPDRGNGLNLFITQLILNFFWSPIFFNAKAYGIASLWLILLIASVIAMILSFRKADLLSAKLQLPYLVWLFFAAYLNFGVWYLNR